MLNYATWILIWLFQRLLYMIYLYKYMLSFEKLYNKFRKIY